MQPYDAKTEKHLLSMSRDNITFGDFWMLNSSDHVTMAHQKVGEGARAMLSMPKKEFNRMVAWYMRDQKPRKRR